MRHRNANFAFTKRHVKKLRFFFETALLETAAFLLPLLPRRLVMALSRGIGSLAYLGDTRGRKTAIDNLRCAFGDRYTDAERRRIARGSYQVFARTFLDLFWSPKLTEKNWQKHFVINITDPAAEEKAHQNGAVWVTPHFGNFELISQVWGFRGFPFTVVAQDFKNPAITRIFKRLREQSGHTFISQDNAMIKLMKALKRKGHAGLLTDLNIVPGRAAAAIQCFGLWTCVPTLHVELAKRLGLSIITGVCRPLPDGRYEANLFEAIEPKADDDTREMTQRVWDRFETAIRENPECWMWMYKHWRYRPVGQPGVPHPDYPYYSNLSPALIEMIPEALRPQEKAA
ncbi:lysophospholipid acyltransferase family protein [Prosthecobacter sp.]|uniref:lysophospholipid acyltransferase family protein n=1 Tax=Prosthecobacter sp. TaxID=1965333 RepID=UPI001D9BC77E|nr:lysophospholipid acyltransferase family protein [Prosthecobacter sp.]MCB1279795.1 lysophospholipid acyltransferase family protein [Prosthecobacter sp.]